MTGMEAEGASKLGLLILVRKIRVAQLFRVAHLIIHI